MPLSHELKRQLFHLSVGFCTILLYSYGILSVHKIAAILLLGLAFSILSKRFRIFFIDWFLDNFERRTDRRRFPGKGAFFFVSGCFLSLAIFEEKIAFAAIVILSIADSLPGIIAAGEHHLNNGKYWRDRNEEKLASGLVAFMLAAFYVHPLAAFLGTVAAIAAEYFIYRLRLFYLDDNLIIPLIAGTAMSAIYVVMF